MGDLTTLSDAVLFCHPTRREGKGGTHAEHPPERVDPVSFRDPTAGAGRSGPGGVTLLLRRPRRDPVEPTVRPAPWRVLRRVRRRRAHGHGAWRPRGDVEGSAPRPPPRSSGCTSPRPAAAGAGPADARPPRGGRPTTPEPGGGAGDRRRPARGDRALRVLGLRRCAGFRLLQGRAALTLLRTQSRPRSSGWRLELLRRGCPPEQPVVVDVAVGVVRPLHPVVVARRLQAPTTYTVDGQQYIALAAFSNVIAFALPEGN